MTGDMRRCRSYRRRGRVYWALVLPGWLRNRSKDLIDAFIGLLRTFLTDLEDIGRLLNSRQGLGNLITTSEHVRIRSRVVLEILLHGSPYFPL